MATDREEWKALVEADTLHLLPVEALVASIKNLASRLLEMQWVPETEYDSTHEPTIGTVRWLPFIKEKGGWVPDSEGKYPDLKLSEDA